MGLTFNFLLGGKMNLDRKICVLTRMVMGLHEEKVVIKAGTKQWFASKTAFDEKILNRLKKVPGLKKISNGNGEKWNFDFAEFIDTATYAQAVVVANSCAEFHRIVWGAGERAKLTPAATPQPVV
jgi:predicted phosphohydrolase